MISDEDRVKNIRERLNTYGRVDAADVEFLLTLLVDETYARYSCFMDLPGALEEAKKRWGGEE